MEIDVLFEDKNFLIVNKPAGLVVHSTLDKKRENLYDLLKCRYPKLFMHHRLDKETSGAIIFSKDESVNHFLENGFKTHSIEKSYHVVVNGGWEYDGELSCFLKKRQNKNGHDVMEVVTKGGVKAISHVKTIKYNSKYSLMNFKLQTGRMHQIRIQCQNMGHPIVGDLVYGTDSAERMYLHSSSLSFSYEDKVISVHAPLDEKFQSFLKSANLI